ncbi:MAG: phenylpyruvate tautomerase MIF-related protein, partial [Gammaproteobacteria bacterium]
MPLLRIQTNQPVEQAKRQELLSIASRLVAEQLGKPEQYIMVSLEPDHSMLFAGSD